MPEITLPVTEDIENTTVPEGKIIPTDDVKDT